ncbi:MAG: ornithine cyclodeaminase, partial [Prevotella buccalis]|nr:ornithine cyclodeaminase [Hoylesella buccalis]
NRFKHFEELSRVLLGQAPGRQTDDERILCYNIGIGLHDALFASHLYDMILERNINCKSFIQHKLDDKFWL